MKIFKNYTCKGTKVQLAWGASNPRTITGKHRSKTLYINTKWKRARFKFEVEGIEVGVSGFSREKLLFIATEVTTGWVREVEEVIVLDEGTRGVREKEV